MQIEWSYEPTNAESGALRDDQKIMRAEALIDARTREGEVRRDSSPFHYPLEDKLVFGIGFLTGALSRLVLRPHVLTPFKQDGARFLGRALLQFAGRRAGGATGCVRTGARAARALPGRHRAAARRLA